MTHFLCKNMKIGFDAIKKSIANFAITTIKAKFI